MVMDSVVELPELAVLRVHADMDGLGTAGAFEQLEAALPTLKGRRFYGTMLISSEGPTYYACVERIDGDTAPTPPLEAGTIPGGMYARRKVDGWENRLADLPRIVHEMIAQNDHDPSRPTVEFYRSQRELHLLLPVRGRTTPQVGGSRAR
jgi:hypothetical protein